MSDQKLRHEIERARRAETILNDPLVKEALQAVRDAAMADFSMADPRDHAALLAAQQAYKAAENFLNVFTEAMETGQLADRQLVAQAGRDRKVRG